MGSIFLYRLKVVMFMFDIVSTVVGDFIFHLSKSLGKVNILFTQTIILLATLLYSIFNTLFSYFNSRDSLHVKEYYWYAIIFINI